MPYFIIEGHGKDSGRKRKPTQVFAKDQDSAIAKAKKQGIVPDSVELVQVTHFVIDVAGISHPNHDGTDRQTIVKRCRTGEKLVLEQEVGNPYDVHAITVFRENGEQLGYVPAALAADVISWHQMGCRYSAVVVQIVPLAEETKLLTVQVCVFVALADANLSRVAKYLSEEMARINPQWQVRAFLPKQQIGAIPWVPVRQSPRDSLGDSVLRSRKRINGAKQGNAQSMKELKAEARAVVCRSLW